MRPRSAENGCPIRFPGIAKALVFKKMNRAISLIQLSRGLVPNSAVGCLQSGSMRNERKCMARAARARIGPVINKMLFIFQCKWSKSLRGRLDCDDTSARLSLPPPPFFRTHRHAQYHRATESFFATLADFLLDSKTNATPHYVFLSTNLCPNLKLKIFHLR